jgi:hypothetical protein
MVGLGLSSAASPPYNVLTQQLSLFTAVALLESRSETIEVKARLGRTVQFVQTNVRRRETFQYLGKHWKTRYSKLSGEAMREVCRGLRDGRNEQLRIQCGPAKVNFLEC